MSPRSLFIIISLCLCADALAYSIISFMNLELTMISGVKSETDSFAEEAMIRTTEFLDRVLTKDYGEEYVRVETVVTSEGISGVGSGGFVQALSLNGSVYFEDSKAPPHDQLLTTLDHAFQADLDVFVEILSNSTDPFFASLNAVDVQTGSVQKSGGKRWGNLGTWAIVGIAGLAGVLSAGLVCLLCICCLGEPDDEVAPCDLSIKRTDSAGSGQTHESRKATTKTSTSEAASGMDLETASDGQDPHNNHHDHFDVQSISSQDSSKFTYNPKTDISLGHFAFHSFRSQEAHGSVIESDLWKYGDGVQDVLEVPFEQDISAIAVGNEGAIELIEESRSIVTTGSLFLHGGTVMSPNERSVGSSGTNGGQSTGLSIAMSDVGIGVTEDEMDSSRNFPRLRSLKAGGGTKKTWKAKRGKRKSVQDELDDLADLVAAHRHSDFDDIHTSDA